MERLWKYLAFKLLFQRADKSAHTLQLPILKVNLLRLERGRLQSPHPPEKTRI